MQEKEEEELTVANEYDIFSIFEAASKILDISQQIKHDLVNVNKEYSSISNTTAQSATNSDMVGVHK